MFYSKFMIYLHLVSIMVYYSCLCNQPNYYFLTVATGEWCPILNTNKQKVSENQSQKRITNQSTHLNFLLQYAINIVLPEKSPILSRKF